ncbi:MAG: hypothetical protein PHU12_01895 [Candidatus Aenigmarchaeota archaeon]|nr:hypothetical protein [Candidatus Aenigmarchaeota archaeon]
MKGQSEIIVYILLFLIGLSLFMASVVWSRGIFDRNSDMAKLSEVESFMTGLDNKIQNVIKFGGQDSIDFRIRGTIELNEPDTIEIRSPLTVQIPEEVNITSSYATITERLEGNLLRVKLTYPVKEYGVDFYTEGPTIATPQKVLIEKGDTYESGGILYIKVKITFK